MKQRRKQICEGLPGPRTSLDDDVVLTIQSPVHRISHADLGGTEFVVAQLPFQDPARAEKLVHCSLSVYSRTRVRNGASEGIFVLGLH